MEEEKVEAPAEESAEGSGDQPSSEEQPKPTEDVPDAESGEASEVGRLKKQLSHAEELIGRQSNEVRQAREYLQMAQQQQVSQTGQAEEKDWFEEMDGKSIDQRIAQHLQPMHRQVAYSQVPMAMNLAMKDKPNLYKGIESDVQRYVDYGCQTGMIQPQVVGDPRTYHTIAIMVRGQKENFDVFSPKSRTVAPTQTEHPASAKSQPQDRVAINRNDPFMQAMKKADGRTWEELEKVINEGEE